MTYVNLRHYHTDCKTFNHPLLDGAKATTEEQLQEMLDSGDRDGLIMGLRSCLRHLVGRYLANWASANNYEEEMVSEGFVGIMSFVNGAPDNLDGRTILKVAQLRISYHIQMMLNKSQSLSSPCCDKQAKLIKAGEDPIYLQSISMIEVDKEEHDSDTYKRDILDALEELEAKDILDRTILSPLFWGKTDKEVADYLGAPRETIRDRRSRLYKEFLNLTR